MKNFLIRTEKEEFGLDSNYDWSADGKFLTYRIAGRKRQPLE